MDWEIPGLISAEISKEDFTEISEEFFAEISQEVPAEISQEVFAEIADPPLKIKVPIKDKINRL